MHLRVMLQKRLIILNRLAIVMIGVFLDSSDETFIYYYVGAAAESLSTYSGSVKQHNRHNIY